MVYYPSIKVTKKNPHIDRIFQEISFNLPNLPKNYINRQVFGRLAATYLEIAETSDFDGDYIFALNSIMFQRWQRGRANLYIVEEQSFKKYYDTKFVRESLEIIPFPSQPSSIIIGLFLPQNSLFTPQQSGIELIWIKVSLNPDKQPQSDTIATGQSVAIQQSIPPETMSVVVIAMDTAEVGWIKEIHYGLNPKDPINNLGSDTQTIADRIFIEQLGNLGFNLLVAAYKLPLAKNYQKIQRI